MSSILILNFFFQISPAHENDDQTMAKCQMTKGPLYVAAAAAAPILTKTMNGVSQNDDNDHDDDDGPSSLRLLPRMIVFDLGDCLWSPEMHELDSKPCIPITGVLNDFAKDDDDDDDDDYDYDNNNSKETTLLRGIVGLQESRVGIQYVCFRMHAKSCMN